MMKERMRVGILACRNLEEEVRAAIRESPFDTAPLIFYNPHCTSPQPGWNEHFSDIHASISEQTDALCIISCGCPYRVGCNKPDIHLFSPEIFLTRVQFRELSGKGVYMITSGFAKGYVSFFPCRDNHDGKDYPLINTGITRIIHLRTREDEDADAGARSLADRLGVPFQVVRIDPDYFRLHLMEALLSLEFQIFRQESQRRVGELKERISDYVMSFDLLGDIAAAETEGEVIKRLSNLFSLLFSPKIVQYVKTPFPEGTTGLILPINYGRENQGWFRLDEFDHPEYLDRYRNTAEFLLPVFGLAIRNARTYQRLLDTNEEKDQEITARKEVQDALFLANKKLNLLTAITRHDIINDVSVAVGYLDLALDLVVSDEVKCTFSRLSERMDAIQRKLEFTRDYQDMGVKNPNWQKIRSYVDGASEAILKGSGIRLENQLWEVEIFADPMLPKVVYPTFPSTPN